MEPNTPEEHQAVREARRLDEQDELRRHAAAHGGPQARAACEEAIAADDEVEA